MVKQFLILIHCFSLLLCHSVLAAPPSPPIATPSMRSARVNTELIQAVKFNSGTHLEKLLKTGANPNTLDSTGTPLLVLALQENAFAAAHILIAHPKIDLEKMNPNQETALMLACFKKQAQLVEDMVTLHHARINKSGWSPLHYAVTGGDIKITQFLLEHHANINAASPNGTTPLMMAARGGDIHIVKLLLDAGADTFTKNQLGLNAADFAEQNHFQEIAQGLRSRMQKLDSHSTNK